MANPVTYTFAGADNDYICQSQTTAGAGSLTLNGIGADANSAAINSPRVWLTGSGFERTVSITSSGTTSSVDFTIIGKDIRGDDVSETIAGPNVTTVYTDAFFYLVTDVSVDGALSTACSVGIGTTGQSQWYKVDYQLSPTNIGLGVTVTGTDVTWTVVQTTYDVEDAEPPAAAILNHSDGSMVSQVVSRQGNYAFPFGATRCLIDGSSTGSLVFNVYQAGIV